MNLLNLFWTFYKILGNPCIWSLFLNPINKFNNTWALMKKSSISYLMFSEGFECCHNNFYFSFLYVTETVILTGTMEFPVKHKIKNVKGKNMEKAIYIHMKGHHQSLYLCWLDQMPFVFELELMFYVPSTNFQFNKDGSSWFEPVLSWDKCVLLKDHNAVRLEPAAPQFRVKHSTTEPLRSLNAFCWNINPPNGLCIKPVKICFCQVLISTYSYISSQPRCYFITNMASSCVYKTVWMLISWLHEKLADLHPHCFHKKVKKLEIVLCIN